MKTISLICGFIIIFLGVFLLDLSRKDLDSHRPGGVEALPTDGLSAIQTRYSMQSQRSFEPHRRSVSGNAFSPRIPRGDREGLIHAYDVENQQFGLTDLAEDSEGERREPPNADNITNGHTLAKEEQ